MKKLFPFLLLLAACGGNGKNSGNTDSSAGDSAGNTVTKRDSATFSTDSLGLPAGVSCEVAGKKTTFVINDTTGLDSLLVDEVYGELDDQYGEGPDSAKNSMPDWDKKSLRGKMDYLYKYPGSFSQMCAETFDLAYEKKFTYPYFMGNGYTVTADRFQKLRTQRDSVIHYFLNDKKGTRFNTYDLLIMMDLNAVELLPRLLGQEKLLRRLAFACADSTPVKLSPKARKAYEKYYSISNRVMLSYQYLLSTMAVIMRQEKSKYILGSLVEHEYATGMKPVNGVITSADKIPAESKTMLFFDPILKRAVAAYDYVYVAFDNNHVGEIVKAAQNYVNFTPADEMAKAAQRMNPWPVDR